MMLRLITFIILSLCPKLIAADFQLSDIPKGKEITLPNPATTIVSPVHAFHVASTDNGQTLKLSLEGEVLEISSVLRSLIESKKMLFISN